ncbi:MAG: cyclase family protein [Ruminococcus sp.]|nr:cyclase family protein [Ruminococcus sp.]
MLIDLTTKITADTIALALKDGNKALIGHWGTHFDVMDKEFPLSYTSLMGIVFDVSGVQDRDIDCTDIDLSKVQSGMFVAFYSGFIENTGYASEGYFSNHPQLSNELIEALIKKKISIIGLDFAGVRRGKEHISTDSNCADNGVFVVENLCNLKSVLDISDSFKAYTFPISLTDATGLMCRVVAEMK